MKSDSSITVNYANHAYAFMKFQEQYKNLCQKISEEKRREVSSGLKKASTFFYEYKTYIKSQELEEYLEKYLVSLKDEMYNDIEFVKLCGNKDKSVNEKIVFNQKYYHYLIKTLRLVGKLGDELSRTFMPNKTDKAKLFRYWNNNSFFEQFTYYKSKAAEALSEFAIKDFKAGLSYFLGFYFAYYLFVDEKSRHLCENIFSNVFNIILNREILKVIETNPIHLSDREKELLKKVDYEVHNALNNIFGRINYSFSEYGIMPRMQKKVLQDTTAI